MLLTEPRYIKTYKIYLLRFDHCDIFSQLSSQNVTPFQLKPPNYSITPRYLPTAQLYWISHKNPRPPVYKTKSPRTWKNSTLNLHRPASFLIIPEPLLIHACCTVNLSFRDNNFASPAPF